MPLPSIIETAEKHLFTDRDKMVAAGLPAATISHLLRLRDAYNYWIAFPNKKDRDIIAVLRERYNIGDTQARSDLKVIKVLLGNFEKTSKDYHRYRFLKIIERAVELAELKKDPDAMTRAADKYAKYMKLDKDDDRADVLETIVPLRLAFTDDPEVIGIKRVPDIRNKVRAMKERYWTEETVDVDFEDIDAELDDIFKPEINNGNTDEQRLP